MMKKFEIYIAALVILAAGCSQGNDNQTSTVRAPVKVRVVRASTESVSGSSGYVGTVEAVRTATVSAGSSGTLTSLNVRRGQRVSKGQEIATIESQTALSAYQMSLATLQQAEDGYERASKVYSSGSISEVQMVEIQTRLDQARAAADAARKTLEDCTLRAPFDGYVAEISVAAGEQLDMFSPVARIIDISELEIRFPVPESEIRLLSEGVRVSVDVEAAGLSGVAGRIVSKGIAASPLSHSYDCTAKLDSPGQGLMPGMVCKVSIDSESSGTVLPASAVQTGVDGRYVWTVRDGKAEKRMVTTGAFSGQGVMIAEGLEDGELVITEGYQKVSTGMKVIAEE